MIHNILANAVSFLYDRVSAVIKKKDGQPSETAEPRSKKKTNIRSVLRKRRNAKVSKSSPSPPELEKVLPTIPEIEPSDTSLSDEIAIPALISSSSNSACTTTAQDHSSLVYPYGNNDVTPEVSASEPATPPTVDIPFVKHCDTASRSSTPQSADASHSFTSNSSFGGVQAETVPLQLDIADDTIQDSVTQLLAYPDDVLQSEISLSPTHTDNALHADTLQSSTLPNDISQSISHQFSAPPTDVPQDAHVDLLAALFDTHIAPNSPTGSSTSLPQPSEVIPATALMYSDSADVKSVLSSPSFHELFTGNVKFKCPNGAYTLTVVLAVVPNKKGYLFTQNNRYEDENRQIHYDKEDIISRCPMVDVMVVRSFAVDELDSEHLGYCHYSAHAIVGEGGFGCAVVYKRHSCEARIPEEVQAMMPMNMVLKFVLNPKEDEDIMLNEIKSMDTLQLEDCPWTVPNLGDVYATPSVITMPYYSATLSDLIPYMTGRCDRVLATYLLAQLIVAVHRIHRSEVVHMDLKPDNIFISDTGHIVVGDMGISRCNVGPGTKIFASDVIGTPPYAAPEVAFGNKFGQEADWYSVGIIAYQLFVGECDAHPFEEPLRDNGEIQVLKPLHKLSHPEGEFIKGMLESDVTQRMTFEKMKNHDIFKHFYLNLREIETRRGSDIVRALLRKYLQA